MESLWQKITRVTKKYLGRSVDYDKAYGNQCVDWARQFASETAEPIWTFSGSALNGWKTGSPFNHKWTRCVYSKGRQPEPGDIIFFDKTSSNPYGHVAVVFSTPNDTNVEIVEQNAWSGNWDGKWANAVTNRLVAYVNGTRGTCVGWYHYKG